MFSERRLDPPHRAADGTGEPRQEQILRIGADLGAEAAAHVGGDHADVGGLDAVGTDRASSRTPCTLWALIQSVSRPSTHADALLRTSSGQPATRWLTTRCETTTSHPSNRSSVRPKVRSIAQFVPGVGEQEGLVAGRGLHVEHDGQRFVVGPHQLGGVGPLVRLLGDDRGDRLADEAHPVHGQHRAGHRRVEHGQLGREQRQVDVRPRVDGQHARRLAGVADVDRPEQRVRDRAADVGDVGGALEVRVAQVRHVGTADREELRVLDPPDPVPEDAHRCPHR